MQQNRIGADNPRQQEEIENLRQQLYDYEVEYTNLQNAYGDLRQRFIDLEAAHNILKQTSEATKTDFRRLQKEYDMMRDDYMRQENKIWEQKNLIKRIIQDAEAKVNNSNNIIITLMIMVKKV